MTSSELTAARLSLGLTRANMGRLLGFPGRDPGRRISAYERGVRPVPPAVALAINLLIMC